MDVSKSEIQQFCKSKSSSALKAAGQYQNRDKAKIFASTVPGTQTDRLEKRCMKKAMTFLNMPPGVSVLDIPCGAGRILPLLKQNGYRVTGADVSASMVEEARCADYDRLEVADVFETGFPDKEFDLVISHRLFQYFNEADDRRKALSELNRISKGPVIVSFSCNYALDFLLYKIKRLFGITRLRSCLPISFNNFAEDANAAGLEVVRWIATRPLISRRWYTIMRPKTDVIASRNPRAAVFSDILLPLLSRTGIYTAVIALLIFAINIFVPDAQNLNSQLMRTVESYVHDDDELYFVAGPGPQTITSDVGVTLSGDKLNIRDIIQKNKSLNKDSLFLLPRQHAENAEKELGNQLQFIQDFVLEKDRLFLFSTETDQVFQD